MAALAILATAALSAPPGDKASTPRVTPPVSADQAMAHYQSLIHDAETGTTGAAADCRDKVSGSIVVCGRTQRPALRLPLPGERAEAGEVVHHLGDPPPSTPAPPPHPVSRAGETLGKLFGLLREAITGEDPDQP